MTTRCGCCGISCTSQGEPPARRARAALRTVRNTHGARGCLRDPHLDWELGGRKAFQGPLTGSPCGWGCCPALVCPLWVCVCAVSPLCASARVCVCLSPSLRGRVQPPACWTASPGPWAVCAFSRGSAVFPEGSVAVGPLHRGLPTSALQPSPLCGRHPCTTPCMTAAPFPTAPSC